MSENIKTREEFYVFDVLIIGGGSAGCAAALTLLNQTSLRVGIVESTDYSQERIGESVSSSISPLLDYLGVKKEFVFSNHLHSNRIDASWGNDRIFSREFFFNAQRNGWNLNRKKFDETLMKKVKEKKGEVFLSTKILKSQKSEKWNLTAIKNNFEKIQIKTNFIIDATGKQAIFLKTLLTEWRIYDRLVGAACIFEGIKTPNNISVTLLESAPDGWWYSTPVPNDRLVVVFMTDNDIAKKRNLQNLDNWKVALQKTNHISKRVKNLKIEKNIRVFPAYSQLLTKLPRLNVIPAGDAAASFDPLSSIGIGHAISSGIHAARLVYSSLESNDDFFSEYIRILEQNFSEYLINKKKIYNIEKRWQKQPFWQRRQKVTN